MGCPRGNLTGPSSSQFMSPLPMKSGPLILLTPFCICQNAFLGRDLLNKLGASIFLEQGEVQRGREFKQRMHLLAALDDPPPGHQNISYDIPQEIREQVDNGSLRYFSAKQSKTCSPL